MHSSAPLAGHSQADAAIRRCQGHSDQAAGPPRRGRIPMKSVLFVCTANMCRSPLAEGLMKRMVDEREEADDWRIESVGVGALDGQPATFESVLVAAERGVDIGGHLSRAATLERLELFSLVLVMEQRHEDILVSEFPQLSARVRLMTELVGETGDIEDPVGTGIENYRLMADRVEEILETGMSRIRELAARQSVE